MIRTILLAGTIAAIFTAPAQACLITVSNSYFFERPPVDLKPDEVVLEAEFVKAEPYRPSLPPGMAEVVVPGQTFEHLKVRRVVSGQFTAREVLTVTPACTGLGGSAGRVGFIVARARPLDPAWTDAPLVYLRYVVNPYEMPTD